MPTFIFRAPENWGWVAATFANFFLSERYTFSPQGTWGKSFLFSLSWSVFPRLRNAWFTMAALLIHASYWGNFSFQLIFLYICLTMDCVRKVLFTSKLEKKKKDSYQTSTKTPNKIFENEWDPKLFWSSKWLCYVFFHPLLSLAMLRIAGVWCYIPVAVLAGIRRQSI